ncbi:MAG TPA: glycosyltransferase family 4 protein [Stellaceae bacterium]|nr:glycosyltransferase family 4 protein [Stellaceae bacterium]
MSASARPDRVVIINDDAIERGGAAAIALTSARLLRQRGVPVTLLSGSGPVDGDLGGRGIAASVLGGRHILARHRFASGALGLFDPTTKAALARWIDEHDTPRTVYHLHNWHKVLSPSVFLALRRVESRLLISAHDYFLACPNGGYFLYPRERECGLTPSSTKCLMTACDRRHNGHKLWRTVRHGLRHRMLDLTRSQARVIAVHEAMVPLLARGPVARAQISVVRNPVTPWRAQRVPAEKNRDVFFVGRLDHDKGADLAARAAQQARVRLRVIGDGPLADLIARNHPGVELLGWRRRDEVADLVADSRLVVVPSRSRETFGLVALEALTSGIPVIVPPYASIAREIADHQFGLVCDPHDEAALAAAMARLAGDDDLVRDTSCNAFAEAWRLAPTPTQWCDELLALYNGRLGDAATPRARLASLEFAGSKGRPS